MDKLRFAIMYLLLELVFDEMVLDHLLISFGTKTVHHRKRFDRFCFSVMVNRNNAAVVSWESERHATVTRLSHYGTFKDLRKEINHLDSAILLYLLFRAFQYVKNIKSLNLSSTASADSASSSNIVDWAEKLYDQLITRLAQSLQESRISYQVISSWLWPGLLKPWPRDNRT
ncbi:hypothetical protein YC2023_043453 [Brassica napus]